MSQEAWNQYYQGNKEPRIIPDELWVSEVKQLPPGRALEFGAGEGAESLWLARQGWEVTAVDFAAAAIARLEQLASCRQLSIQGVVADILDYQPVPKYNLVWMCYLHLDAAERMRMLRNAAAGLASNGILLYIGIARPDGQAEIQLPYRRFSTIDDIVAGLPGLLIERAEKIRHTISQPGSHLEADFLIIRARRLE